MIWSALHRRGLASWQTIAIPCGAGIFGNGALPSTASLAQDTSSVVVGQQIRVLASTLGGAPRAGVLAGIAPNQIVFRDRAKSGPVFNVPHADIRRIEVQYPRSKATLLKGTALGALIGGLVFGIGSYAASRDDPHRDMNVLVLTPFGIGLGGAVGTYAGVVHRNSRWREIPVPR